MKKRKFMFLGAVLCLLSVSMQAFAYGGDFKFGFISGNEGSIMAEGEPWMTKARDGDQYAYVTARSGGIAGNVAEYNATIYIRVRNSDAKRSYATEYCTVTKHVLNKTQKIKYLDASAGNAGRSYYLYGSVGGSDKYPLVVTGTWCP